MSRASRRSLLTLLRASFLAHGGRVFCTARPVALIFSALAGADLVMASTSLFYSVGLTLVLVGLIARAAIAPFHPWSPDVHEGAPSFVTTHVSTIAQATNVSRVSASVACCAGPAFSGARKHWRAHPRIVDDTWGCGFGVGTRHGAHPSWAPAPWSVGWSLDKSAFLTLALVEVQGDGARALLLGLIASGVSIAGVMATLSSLSHHERACEHVGDLAGMMQESPVRAGLFGLFLLSLGGLPGTIGFLARFRTLASLEHGGHRVALLIGLGATVLALMAISRPLLAMLRPSDGSGGASRALSNEQFVLAILCRDCRLLRSYARLWAKRTWRGNFRFGSTEPLSLYAWPPPIR